MHLLILFILAVPLFAQVDPAAARIEAIESSKKAIEAECERAAGGDWQRWFDKLAPFRLTIRALVDHAVDNAIPNEKNPNVKYGLMRWTSDPNQYVHANTAISLGFFGDVRRDPRLAKDPIYWAKSTPMLTTAIKMQAWLA